MESTRWSPACRSASGRARRNELRGDRVGLLREGATQVVERREEGVEHRRPRLVPAEPIELLHGAAGMRQQQLARLGRIGPLADALEQRQPELTLELAHLHA